MVHHSNLAMQILLNLLLMIWFQNLLQTFEYKTNLEFTRLVELMETREQDHSKCENEMDLNSILSLTKQVIAKCKTLLIKMALENFTSKPSWIINIFMTPRFCLNSLATCIYWSLCMLSLSLHKWNTFLCMIQ